MCNFAILKLVYVREHLVLRKPICCFSFLKGPLFLISSWETGMSRAARSSQDWDHGKEHLLGFPSATFQDYPFCCNWWNFILFNGWVIILLKIYKHAFLLIKYPCFTRDLGPPRPSFCLWIVLQSVESYRSHFLAQLGFQDLLERTLWASVSGVSPMYGLYWFST